MQTASHRLFPGFLALFMSLFVFFILLKPLLADEVFAPPVWGPNKVSLGKDLANIDLLNILVLSTKKQLKLSSKKVVVIQKVF